MIANADDFRAWMVVMGHRRGKASISVREAEEALGYSRESISAILKGERRVPKYIALACRSLALDVPAIHPEELAEGPIYKVCLVVDRRAG
jgi:hypothetical protein